MQNRDGLLLVVSGPAGVGKGTINGLMLERHSDIRMSVSVTTRKPRPGEIEGVHYFYRSEEEFLDMAKRGKFLEYMHVFGSHYYGTPRSFVESELSCGRSVMLEIDVQGALKVKSSFPDALLVFIAPPSMSQLKSRLIGRGTETPEQIERRSATAFEELRHISSFDYVIVNDVIDAAVSRFEAILRAERCRVSRNSDFIESIQKGVQ
ncbi:MAG TPA: guanylate kinase [Clostridia bacterium]|nr:guanylate kinase [Clostridia bacterium]